MKEITAKGSGKAWHRNVVLAKKRVRDSDLYFIRRSGGWFRPDAHGYTGNLADAGTFVGANAKGYLNAEGVGLVAARDLLPMLTKQMRDHVVAAQSLNAVIQQFD